MKTRSSSIARKTRGAARKGHAATRAKLEVTASTSRSGHKRPPSRKVAVEPPVQEVSREVATEPAQTTEKSARAATRRARRVQSVSAAPRVAASRRKTAASASIVSEPNKVRRSRKVPDEDMEVEVASAPVETVSSRQDEGKLRKLEKELQKKQESMDRKQDQHKLAVANFRKNLADLTKREKACVKKEAEYARSETHLQARETVLSQKEQEAADLLASINASRSQQVLKELEEDFSCSLCFEIMACPCTLTSPHCGHSFCAACILQWFFSHLHDNCGSFHQQVECPLCRTSLCMPLPEHPRAIFSCPFTPNRLADKAILDRLEILRSAGPTPLRSPGASGLHSQKSAETVDPSLAWREGGHARTEWLARDEKGRSVLRRLASIWSTATGAQFRSIKERLSS